jgi:hypothetical protein
VTTGIYVRHMGRAVTTGRVFGPSEDSAPARIRLVSDAVRERMPCLACGKPFLDGEHSVLVVLGPGDDEEAQVKCANNRYYNAVAVQIHAARAGLDVT